MQAAAALTENSKHSKEQDLSKLDRFGYMIAIIANIGLGLFFGIIG